MIITTDLVLACWYDQPLLAFMGDTQYNCDDAFVSVHKGTDSRVSSCKFWYKYSSGGSDSSKSIKSQLNHKASAAHKEATSSNSLHLELK
jgi:hypothetical protein